MSRISEKECYCCPFQDEVLLDVWQVIDDIVMLQTSLESWMKNGFINIAKSRYIMGQQSVCAQRIPSSDISISASALVERTTDSTDETKVKPFSTFTAVFSGHDTRAQPLRWFSALPPGALKSAQQQFSRVVQIACEIATLKSLLSNMLISLPKQCAMFDKVLDHISSVRLQ